MASSRHDRWILVGAFGVGFLFLAGLIYGYERLPGDDHGYARHGYLRDLITWASGLVALAFCLGMAVWLLLQVFRGRWRAWPAAGVFLLAAVATPIVPVPLMLFGDLLVTAARLYSGDDGFALLVVPYLLLLIAGCVLPVFLVVLVWAAKRGPRARREDGSRGTSNPDGT